MNLYTREYFALARGRLSDNGFMTYWLPVARRGEYDVLPIIKAFCDVFPNCSLWNAAPLDWMLMGINGPPRQVSEGHVVSFAGEPGVEQHMQEIGIEAPQQIGLTFLGDAAYLEGLIRDPAAY